jgi:hypothetical protein
MSANRRIYNYLKFKSKRKGFIGGRCIMRQFGLSMKEIARLNDIPGVGSIGPAGDSGDNPRKRARYVKYNAFDGGILVFFRTEKRIYCYKDRPLRKGIWMPPRKHSPIRKENHV